MQLGELDFRLIEHLAEERLTPKAARREFDDYSYGHLRRRLAALADETDLVRRVDDAGALYEATVAGEEAAELRCEYEADDDMAQVEFYDRLRTEVLAENDD